MMTRRTVLSNKPATKLGGTGAIRPNPCKRYLVPRASVALEEQSSRGTDNTASSDWAVISVHNGPTKQAFSQFVEVGQAICVEARVLQIQVGEQVQFKEVLAYKRGNEQLKRKNKRSYLTDVCVQGVCTDEFMAPASSGASPQMLQKVLITKVEGEGEGAEDFEKCL